MKKIGRWFLFSVVACIMMSLSVVVLAETNKSPSPIPLMLVNPALSGLVRIQLDNAAPAAGIVPKAGWIMSWMTVDGSGNAIWNYRGNSGVSKQLKVADLTTIGALTPTNGDVIQRVSGAWANRSMAQLKTSMAMYASDIIDGVPNTRTVGGTALSADITAAQLKASLIANGLYSSDITAAGDSQYLSAAQKAVVVGNTGTTKAGMYEAIADDDTAGTKTIATGLTTIGYFSVTILRSGVQVFSDQVVSVSGGNIIVADGGATYVITAGDKIYWTATGGL
jgi:hypothetical protein